MSLDKLKKFVRENIANNIKKISAIIGDIIITIITIALFAVKGGIDAVTTLIMIIFGIKPFIVMYLNLVFKGEANAEMIKNLELENLLSHQREIAEYRCQLAARDAKVPDAIISNQEWNEANALLEKQDTDEGK